MGNEPWANDDAADWLGDLMDETRLAQHVEEALSQDIDEFSILTIRAAAGLLILLGQVYIWPFNDLDRHCLLAAEKLEQCAEVEKDTNIRDLILAEAKYLRLTAKKDSTDDELVPAFLRIYAKWKS